MTAPHRLAAVLLLAATPAAAQEFPGDPGAGGELALRVCGVCHFVASEQVDPVSAEAPPFDEIAADPAVTELSLRVFLRTPHTQMPDLVLTPQETDDVISYILTLKAP
ncbi:MAG: c-type cytochrome [Alphaproteobacteria bacterium]